MIVNNYLLICAEVSVKREEKKKKNLFLNGTFHLE